MNISNQLKSKDNITYLPNAIDEGRVFIAKILLQEHFELLIGHENLEEENFGFMGKISEQTFFCQHVRRIAMLMRKFEIQRIKNKSVASEIQAPEIYECSEFKNAIRQMLKLFKDFKSKQKIVKLPSSFAKLQNFVSLFFSLLGKRTTALMQIHAN